MAGTSFRDGQPMTRLESSGSGYFTTTPETSQISSEAAQTSPETAQTSPETTQTLSKAAQTSLQTSQQPPEGTQNTNSGGSTDVPMLSCMVCSFPTITVQCEGCRAVVYCSIHCQLFDWDNGHSHFCQLHRIGLS
ncbi:hypothetical protein BT63DRAFT_271005 [Microthyrium microscopicum]|uniref:MYND-type domain-containing protein n=1 Tax=Microthyrium microscopicum TaxID=703497 RepID=A0A6A6U9V1_9PEZI|nr:hypothetical protein BT63DRAFT_271005 [Microthyrium microscopicum]